MANESGEIGLMAREMTNQPVVERRRLPTFKEFLEALPHPAEVIGDAADTVIDVVAFPAELVRTVRLSAGVGKDQLVDAAKRGASLPEPIGLLRGVGDSAVDEARATANNVRSRLEKFQPALSLIAPSGAPVAASMPNIETETPIEGSLSGDETPPTG